MRQHPEIGYRLLAGSGGELLDLAATLARTHHERMDGARYPRGLAGEAIPIEGRIAAVADVFDALTSHRVYRPAYSAEEAIGLMTLERGSHFDPDLFDLFVESLAEVLAIKEEFGDRRASRAGAFHPRAWAHVEP